MSEYTADEGPQAPQTVWEHTLLYADLLVRAHLDRADRLHAPGRTYHPLSAEETAVLGTDRELLLVTLAAAIHEQIRRQEPGEPTGVLLHSPDTGGVEDVLRYAPYGALEAAVAAEGRGGPQVRQLLEAGGSSHPDGQLLWQRVRTAAQDVVEGAVDPGRGTSVTVADLLAGEQRKATLDQLAQVMGTED